MQKAGGWLVCRISGFKTPPFDYDWSMQQTQGWYMITSRRNGGVRPKLGINAQLE
jgi:hypothetical protein